MVEGTFLSDLLNWDSNVDISIIIDMEKKTIITEMNNTFFIDEIQTSIEKFNLGKAPGIDGQPT